MIEKIIEKIRALIGDFSNTSFDIFEYTTSNIFTIVQSNITSIDKVLKNGDALTSGEYSFNSTTNKITITLASGSEFSSGDKLEVDYTYSEYSDSELKEFIRASLVWISVYSDDKNDYELQNDNIYPTPDNKSTDLISLVASILIKPNYVEKRLPNLTIKYPKTMSKEEVIEKLVIRFNRGIGEVSTITII